MLCVWGGVGVGWGGPGRVVPLCMPAIRTQHRAGAGKQILLLMPLCATLLLLPLQEWAEHLKTLNSGTYNNQYMVVDLKKFKPREARGWWGVCGGGVCGVSGLGNVWLGCVRGHLTPVHYYNQYMVVDLKKFKPREVGWGGKCVVGAWRGGT